MTPNYKVAYGVYTIQGKSVNILSFIKYTNSKLFLKVGIIMLVNNGHRDPTYLERMCSWAVLGRKSGSCSKLGCFTRWVEFVLFLYH